MDTQMLYSLTADLTLALHVVYVLFVVLGLGLIYVGKFRNWFWVRHPWFRILHLLSIGIVVLQSWLGIICPLTVLEMWLREKAGGVTYSGGFISHWLETLLYYEAPAWVFALCYTVFGILVTVSWFWVRPRRFSRKSTLR